MFTGLTDRWARTIRPDEATVVNIDATDFQQGLATHTSPASSPKQSPAPASNRCSRPTGHHCGGARMSRPAPSPSTAKRSKTTPPFALIEAAAAVDDGRIYVNANGDFIFEDDAWRYGRDVQVVFLGRGAARLPDERKRPLRLQDDRDVVGLLQQRGRRLLHLRRHETVREHRAGERAADRLRYRVFEAADSAEDVVNEIILGYTPAAGGTVVNYSAIDAESIAGYGKRGYRRDDLTPKTPAPLLNDLAEMLLSRSRSAYASGRRRGR